MLGGGGVQWFVLVSFYDICNLILSGKWTVQSQILQRILLKEQNTSR